MNQKAITKLQNFIPGLEGIEQDMLIIPRLKLVQKNSVEVDSGTAPGTIVNSVSKEVICKNKSEMIIIPLSIQRTRIYFKPFADGGGLLCRSFNGITGRGNPGGKCLGCVNNPDPWPVDPKTGKEIPPPCIEFINIFCIVRDYDFPIPMTASFGRTSLKSGKSLVNFLWADASKANKSPWNFAYNLSAELTENEYGKFYVFKTAPAGKANATEIKQGEKFYKVIKSTRHEIHEDEDEIREEQERNAKGSVTEKDDSAPHMQAEDDEEINKIFSDDE